MLVVAQSSRAPRRNQQNGLPNGQEQASLSAADVDGYGTLSTSTLAVRTHSTTAAYNGDTTVVPSTSPVVSQIAQAAIVVLSPTSLTFGNQTVGVPSTSQSVTLENTGNIALNISSITITGTNPLSFSQTNTCGSSLAASTSCAINVTFKPTYTGGRNAAVTITDNASNSPQSLSLTGAGVLPAVTLSPTSLTFPAQLVSTTSTVKTVKLTNSGRGVLKITNIAVTGQFGQSNNCGSTVNPAGSCTLAVTFNPTAAGSVTGSISITNNARFSPENVTLNGTGAYVQLTSFQHIVVMVQENRTPDNLFQGLCIPPYGSEGACGTTPSQYDIQSYGFDVNGTRVPLSPVPLGNAYDPWHDHAGFEAMCNPNPTTYFPCNRNTRLSTSGCLPYPNNNCPFEYVDPIATPSVYSYLYIAQNFGWANRMFQTNQGSSAPAHQFLFGGTSASSAAADANATFIDETDGLGCLAALNAGYKLIDPAHAPFRVSLVNNPLGTLCYTHETMATLLENSQHTWRYYTIGDTWSNVSYSIWTAPNAIQQICQPNSTFTQCTGEDWIKNVDLNPSDVLTDLQNCKLKNMVWVIPTGQNSDHPSPNYPYDGGPAWVANVINGVTRSPCTDNVDQVQVPYWADTAIIVTWDDWGGFYDHVLPPFLSAPKQGQGDYQMGFRVPLLFVSAYTNHIVDSVNQYDFGSILRFSEQNFGISEGLLGFADQRSATDLTAFYDFSLPATKFLIPTTVPAEVFLNDKRPPEPPDND